MSVGGSCCGSSPASKAPASARFSRSPTVCGWSSPPKSQQPSGQPHPAQPPPPHVGQLDQRPPVHPATPGQQVSGNRARHGARTMDRIFLSSGNSATSSEHDQDRISGLSSNKYVRVPYALLPYAGASPLMRFFMADLTVPPASAMGLIGAAGENTEAVRARSQCARCKSEPIRGLALTARPGANGNQPVAGADPAQRAWNTPPYSLQLSCQWVGGPLPG